MAKRIIATLLAVGLLAAACGDDDPSEDDDVGLANPASVYCIEQGGDLDIRDRDTGQYGVCMFDDGSECGEWDFYHGECAPGDQAAGEAGLANPASVYCGEQGGTLEMRNGDGGQIGVCVFDDGSECEEWAYLRGECEPGG